MLRYLFAALSVALLATPAAAQEASTSPPDMTDAIAALQAQIPDVSTLATKSEVAAVQASTVKSVNGAAPNASGAVTLPIPTASTTTPLCIGDSSAPGTPGTMQFAPFNHTHCSKVRRATLTSGADGTVTFNYSATPFTNPPVCTAVAEVAAGVTDVVNVQVVGTPTISSAALLVNRTNRSVAALLGLTILSVPAQPGVTKVHAICIEP